MFPVAGLTAELPQNAGIGTTVIIVQASGTGNTYSIASGDPASIFGINPVSGVITLNGALNPAVQTYTLGVMATNSVGSAQTTLAIGVTAASIADLIGSTKPMTAVLFSNQERNTFEVASDPSSTDPSLGIINQSQSGSTAGFLVAAEAPFAFPTFRDDKAKFTMPIGAWFGVHLTTGGGEDVSGVDLAAGLSFSFLSTQTSTRLLSGGGAGLVGSSRLLLGVIYGQVVTLGAKSAGNTLQVGDSYALGDAPPLNKDRQISFAVGLGFRF